MNEKLVTAVESKNDKFEEATVGVEAEPELPCGVVVTYICVKNAVFGSMNAGFCADAVLQCGRMRSHYAASSQARTAARIASERLTCSRSAREANAFKRVASMRTGITSPGPSPIGHVRRRGRHGRRACHAGHHRCDGAHPYDHQCSRGAQPARSSDGVEWQLLRSRTSPAC